MIDYIYIGMIISFVILLLVIAKVEDGEDMKARDEEEK